MTILPGAEPVTPGAGVAEDHSEYAAPITLIAETMCHGVAETELAVRRRLDSVGVVTETELAVRRRLDSVGLVAETELAVTHWPDDATVPDVGRHVSRIAEANIRHIRLL